MKIIGLISDKINNEYPIQLDTYTLLAINYSSNIAETVANLDAFSSNLKGQVKLFLKVMPKFSEVYDTFKSTKCPLFASDQQLDLCLSLFYNPYFNEFYLRFKEEMATISKRHLNYIKKNFLLVLSSAIYYNVIYGTDIFEENKIKDYFIRNNVYSNCKELLELINEITT